LFPKHVFTLERQKAIYYFVGPAFPVVLILHPPFVKSSSEIVFEKSLLACDVGRGVEEGGAGENLCLVLWQRMAARPSCLSIVDIGMKACYFSYVRR
jgi:hypothetical protein